MDRFIAEDEGGDGAAARDTPTPDELKQRALALVPEIRERAARCEADRRIPEETMRSLHETGLFNVIKPRAYGGYEMGWDVFCELTMILSRACGSTGWVYGVVGQHALIMNRFGIDAMDDIWRENPDALMSSSKHIKGSFKKVDGGYAGSGVSTFSSGCLHSDWVLIGGAPVDGEDGAIGAIVKQSEIEILDTWDALGLAGTGSHDIKFDNVFVPGHRVRSPGRKPSGGIIDMPAFRVTAPGGPFSLASVMVGLARGAVDDFVETTRSRSSRFGAQIGDFQSMQMRIGEAAVEVDAAETLLRSHVKKVMAQLEKAPPPTGAGGIDFSPGGNAPFPPARGPEILANAFVAQLALKAIDRVFYAAGASQMVGGGFLQRCFRDAQTGSRQFGLNWDIARTNGGRALLGR